MRINRGIFHTDLAMVMSVLQNALKMTLAARQREES